MVSALNAKMVLGRDFENRLDEKAICSDGDQSINLTARSLTASMTNVPLMEARDEVEAGNAHPNALARVQRVRDEAVAVRIRSHPLGESLPDMIQGSVFADEQSI